MKRASVLLSIFVLFAACQSVPTEIPDDLTMSELVQLAQEAADDENNEAAIAYYQAVLERFPQDAVASTTARYEIAFLQYKNGELESARAGFEALLGLYDFDQGVLPLWPKVLAEKLIAEMDAATAEE
jgi:outer membrane protein assembly factor BamD